MKKLCILYWPKGGNVEHAASLIYKNCPEKDTDIIELNDFKPDDFHKYEHFIIGGSTVGADHWSDASQFHKWNPFFADMQKQNIDFKGKKIALFGLGDQNRYPQHFCDEMAIMKTEFENQNAKIIGAYFDENYEHVESEAFQDDVFVGLALDEDSQPEFTEERIKKWLHDLFIEFDM